MPYILCVWLYRERQQQLEELTKELTKVSEETNMLRMKLKSLKSKVGGVTGIIILYNSQ